VWYTDEELDAVGARLDDLPVVDYFPCRSDDAIYSQEG
jgi:hypothetical protein